MIKICDFRYNDTDDEKKASENSTDLLNCPHGVRIACGRNAGRFQ